ncbi:MAG: cytochrome c peroxidase [Polyangiaceae bacterium]
MFASLIRSHGFTASLCLLSAVAASGCAPADATDSQEEDVAASPAALCQSQKNEGKRLFEKETFGGNGRTCLTCHSKSTGTLNPSQIQALYADDPDSPLFQLDGSDDFEGNGYQRIQADATILVRIPLPPNVTLADDPNATHVVLRRGIPTTLNTPALDPVLMYDGRAPTLEAQALDAIHGHAESTIEPTPAQLHLIAEHQKTDAFFTSHALEDYADGGPAPSLPMGHTAAEKRGRLWFEDAPVGPNLNSQSPRKGLCAMCHSGPMLNVSNGHNPLPPHLLGDPFAPPGSPGAAPCNKPWTEAEVSHVPKGTRFQSVLVSDFNLGNNPLYNFVLHLPDGTNVALPPTPDPGRALITGNFTAFPTPGSEFNNFKIPTLWGVKKTAPYFHNNSAKTLEEVVNHYATFFAFATDCFVDGDPPLVMTAGDKADLLAFLKLL